MSKVVNTYGVASKFVTSALMGLGATETDPSGRFYIDGTMVNVEMAEAIAQAIYIQRIFRNGQSVTEKYTSKPMNGGAVRVPLETPLPFASRTLEYGGRRGTKGNAGVINRNSAQLSTDDEFIVYTNQINDQRMLFPELSKQFMPLDIAASKMGSYAQRVAMDRDASTLAEILAYSIFRSLNDGKNIVNTGDLSGDNAYADLINDVNSLMDNGDIVRGAFTYNTEGRTIIGRPSFVNHIFSKKSGVILMGGDLAQEMLRSYDLEANIGSRDYVGTGYKGKAMGFHIQSCPNYIWSLAETYLQLPAGSLNKVQAIAVSAEATALATGIDLGIKIVDSIEVRGAMAQPLNIWGHEAFRKSFIIADDGVDNGTFTGLGFTADTRVYPIAPTDIELNKTNKIQVPIYDSNNAIIGYREIANAPLPNGDNVQSGVKSVANVTANVESGVVPTGTSVTFTSATSGATLYYTDDGTVPTSKSNRYTVPLVVNASKTYKFVAIKTGLAPSSVSVYSYTVEA